MSCSQVNAYDAFLSHPNRLKSFMSFCPYVLLFSTYFYLNGAVNMDSHAHTDTYRCKMQTNTHTHTLTVGLKSLITDDCYQLITQTQTPAYHLPWNLIRPSLFCYLHDIMVQSMPEHFQAHLLVSKEGWGECGDICFSLLPQTFDNSLNSGKQL